MNTEIGATLVNGFSMHKAMSIIYNDLRERIEINSVASKYIFVNISDLTPEFNIIKKYPISIFKTFTNVAEVNSMNITIIPATLYNLKCTGIVTLVDVSSMVLKGIGMIKSTTITDVEILWMEYISESKQLISEDVGNLISVGKDGRLFLSNNDVEIVSNKNNYINSDIKIVKVFETYIDYDPKEIKKIENVHDGQHIVILKDQLHNNKTWLYVLSSTDAISPVISPVREYTDINKYPSSLAVKAYIDSAMLKSNKEFDNDTIVHNTNSDLWEVALDHHSINKNKNGLYAVDFNVLKTELLNIISNENNVAIFDNTGYIKDDGYGITKDDEPIDDEYKKLITKTYLKNQYITESETSDLITLQKLNNY